MARTDRGAVVDEAAAQAPGIFIADRMLQGFPDDQTQYVE